MWIVGESSVSNQGRQSWEGVESKAGEETERIRKQKNQKLKNEDLEIDMVNLRFLVFSVKHISTFFPLITLFTISAN